MARLVAAAVLFGLAAVVLALYLSKEQDCVRGEGIYELGGVLGSALACLGVAAVVWTRAWRWRLIFGAGAFILTFVPVTVVAFVDALGECAPT